MQQTVSDLSQQVSNIESRLANVNQEHSMIEHKLALGKHRLALIEDLEKNGIGLKDLTSLRDTVLEIFAANMDNGRTPNPHVAFRKFVKDIEEQYDRKLGFERKIAEMEKSLSTAREQCRSISNEYSRLKDVYDSARELFEHGVDENDIIYWNKLIKRNRIDLFRLDQDLDGSLTGELDELAAKVKSLRIEFNSLLSKVNDLRGGEGRISHTYISYQLEEETKLVQKFLKNLEEKISE
jgi:hypothetical protein